MSDVFWAAVISGGTVIAVALLTLLLSLRIASQRAKQEERLEQARWERAESSRQAEIALQAARRQSKRQAALLRDFWQYVLDASVRVTMLAELHGTNRELAVQEEPSVYSAQACAAALLGLKTVYPLAKVFHAATVQMQIAARDRDFSAVPLSLHAWGKTLEALEEEVARQSGIVGEPDAAKDDGAGAAC